MPNVLIAEGDAELREAYRRFLRGYGYEVETASDGLDCLEKLRRSRPAVLVLDREIRWGGADGVLACLREEAGLAGVPVVLTSQPGPEAAPGPSVQLLPRPFPLAALLGSVRAASPCRPDPYERLDDDSQGQSLWGDDLN